MTGAKVSRVGTDRQGAVWRRCMLAPCASIRPFEMCGSATTRERGRAAIVHNHCSAASAGPRAAQRRVWMTVALPWHGRRQQGCRQCVKRTPSQRPAAASCRLCPNQAAVLVHLLALAANLAGPGGPLLCSGAARPAPRWHPAQEPAQPAPHWHLRQVARAGCSGALPSSAQELPSQAFQPS